MHFSYYCKFSFFLLHGLIHKNDCIYLPQGIMMSDFYFLCAIGHQILFFLIHQCFLWDFIPSHWKPSDLPQVLWIWESIFYSKVLFTCHYFPNFQGFTSVSRSTSKLAGFHAVVQNIVSAQLFVWITKQSTNLLFRRIDL